MQQFEPGNRPKILVFLTDGLPTVGVTIPEQIYRQRAQRSDTQPASFSRLRWLRRQHRVAGQAGR